MLPEATVEGMQESCAERQYSTTGSPVDTIIKQEPTSWTPEDFLQSTLEEGAGVVSTGSGDPPVSAKPRGRRKQQWKLKFHHQALPPEYLDHYEASLSKAQTMAQPKSNKQSPQDATKSSSLMAALPEESVQNWLQRISSIQNEIQKINSNNSVQQVVPQQPTRKRRTNAATNSTPTVNKVVNYRDLPYMGEMTLNNSKPRRGRKPKKADICHLIYKNYGTIFPGTPSHLVDERLNMAAPLNLDNLPGIKQEPLPGAPFKQRTDIQNKIISSLLEKRLSQENKKVKDTKQKKHKVVQMNEEEMLARIAKQTMPPPTMIDTEPLNLCVRDLNNLKIRLLRKHGNVYAKAEEESKIKIECQDVVPEENPEVLSEPATSTTNAENSTLKMGVLDFNKALQDSNLLSDPSLFKKPEGEGESQLPGGYVYWPNAGVFLHPLALQSQLMYYQNLAAGNSLAVPTERSSPNESLSSIKSERQTPNLENETQLSPGGSSESSTSTIRSKNSTVKPERSPRAPAKRKRSAIFIPPVPGDSSTSPATEVSICKFKFTGGAKPSLQEKKMLSVDSGGNFRYYSGTGDKANRGYEFFPRESLQNSTSTSGSILSQPAPIVSAPPPSSTELTRRKRKSRKSLQREKLEQTFKEKGFLIQTQQLESAEGATYCKFRQLRKFTRYLFRSWKDYLPGAVQAEGENPGPVIAPAELSTSSSPVASDWT